MIPPDDFWGASGHHLCDRDARGRLLATPDLWRAFLARPELLPPPEACEAEHALHATLLADPLRDADTAKLADADARENWQVFLRFRDRVQATATLEAAWCALYRGDVHGTPPIFLQMLTHLVARAALDGEPDPFALRAGEMCFRPQRAAIHQGATLLADAEYLDAQAAATGPLGRIIAAAGGEAVTLDVLSAENAAGYRARSDAHDLALDIAQGRAGAAGLARALERFIGHVIGAAVRIRPVPVIAEPTASWTLGLDAEASAIANELWHGVAVPQVRLARILWLAEVTFAEATALLPRAAGRLVHLALAMDAAQRVRMKPQNLVTGLPLA
jgi:hypothetical protein